MAIVHYASYVVNNTEVYGTATLLNGSGYLFRQNGARQARLISYKDVDLMLYGRCDIADAQWADDSSQGDLAALIAGRAA